MVVGVGAVVVPDVDEVVAAVVWVVVRTAEVGAGVGNDSTITSTLRYTSALICLRTVVSCPELTANCSAKLAAATWAGLPDTVNTTLTPVERRRPELTMLIIWMSWALMPVRTRESASNRSEALTDEALTLLSLITKLGGSCVVGGVVGAADVVGSVVKVALMGGVLSAGKELEEVAAGEAVVVNTAAVVVEAEAVSVAGVPVALAAVAPVDKGGAVDNPTPPLVKVDCTLAAAAIVVPTEVVPTSEVVSEPAAIDVVLAGAGAVEAARVSLAVAAVAAAEAVSETTAVGVGGKTLLLSEMLGAVVLP